MSYDFDYSDYQEYESIVKTIAWSYVAKRKVHISEAIEKRELLAPYIDTETNEEVVPRKCYDKTDHFAFKPLETPIVGRGESVLHYECKIEICRSLDEKIPTGKWACERRMSKSSSGPELIPDISGRLFKEWSNEDGWPVVIEVQASTYSIDQIIKRTKYYNSRKCSILWVIPLKEDFTSEVYRPRLMEAFLHSMYFGRVYYWMKGMGSKVIPVHFDTAYRFVEHSEWYSEGELKAAGGYEKPYKLIKKLNILYPIDINEFFCPKIRPTFVPASKKKIIPECNIFHDKFPMGW